MVIGTHLQQAGVMTRELAMHLRAADASVEAVSVEVRDGIEQLTKHVAGAVPDEKSLGHHAFMVQRATGSDGRAGVAWHANTPGVKAGVAPGVDVSDGMYHLRSSGFSPWTQIGGDPGAPRASQLVVES